MPIPMLTALAAVFVVATALWVRRAAAPRVRYHACGYRMIRPRRSHAIVISNGFGAGMLAGLGSVLLAVALLAN